ncbi:RES family NAD+ phosphorylase [Rhizobium etli]|uniref:RES family NAD+ phosphorylase n=1 Tax=Rhizobium etli TaxID=29449 RepID=UPI001FDABF7A|nr:RES family NAD+ phosphorylase [Rhizobium etli]
MIASFLKTQFSRIGHFARPPKPMACSNCFSDRGLRFDAERFGRKRSAACPNCQAVGCGQLTRDQLLELSYRFFVWGSMQRAAYGAAPLVQFNDQRSTSIEVEPWLKPDVDLLEQLLGIGFFYYGPRLWMVGEVEPLKALQRKKQRSRILKRILKEYPARSIGPTATFFRIRVNPERPNDPSQYDSPPVAFTGNGRLDSPGKPILYGSPDLEICVHECRVSAEDEVFAATLAPLRDLRLLDLSVLLPEEEAVTEFESLDMAVHMLFLAGKHAYDITRTIAESAQSAGFDGVIYPSYFSLLRSGAMPFETTFGISHRRIKRLQEREEVKSIPNIALFGWPIAEGKVSVGCINRVIISRVAYGFHFGPTFSDLGS